MAKLECGIRNIMVRHGRRSRWCIGMDADSPAPALQRAFTSYSLSVT